MMHPVGFRANRMISDLTGIHPVPGQLQDVFFIFYVFIVFCVLYSLVYLLLLWFAQLGGLRPPKLLLFRGASPPGRHRPESLLNKPQITPK